MQIIPVIDLMGGVAVHAKRGQRENYRPLQSPLCAGAKPHAVIDGLLGLHGFDTFYIADLDALMGRGSQRDVVAGLQRDYPGLRFWLDQGLAEPVGQAVPVIGSESLGADGPGFLQSLGGGFILSLDFIGERLLGPENLLDETGVWPETVIVMSLSHVGANEGPDFRRLEALLRHGPRRRIIAAGGVRDAEDLRRLEGLGVGGVLLASALHSGALEASVLREFGGGGDGEAWGRG